MISAAPGPLTKEQRQILDWIGDYTIDHGYAPSYREIAQGFGYAHHSTAQHHMRNLRRLGWVRWVSGRSNTLQFFHPDGTWQSTPPPKLK